MPTEIASFTFSVLEDDVNIIQGGVANFSSSLTACYNSIPLMPGMFQSQITTLIFTFAIINNASRPPDASKTWIKPASRKIALVKVALKPHQQ